MCDSKTPANSKDQAQIPLHVLIEREVARQLALQQDRPEPAKLCPSCQEPLPEWAACPDAPAESGEREAVALLRRWRDHFRMEPDCGIVLDTDALLNRIAAPSEQEGSGELTPDSQEAGIAPSCPEQEAPAKEHNAYTCDCGVCSACNGRDLRQEPGGEETESDRLSVAYTAGAMSRDAEIDALKQEVERLEDLAEGRKVMFKYERRKREQAQQERDTLRNLSLSLGNEKEVVEKQRDGWMERHELVSAQKKIVEAERDQFATEAHRQGWDDCVEAIGRNPFMLPLDELIYPGPKEDEDDYDYAADDRAYDEARERKL